MMRTAACLGLLATLLLGAPAPAAAAGTDVTARGIEDTIKALNAVQGNPQAQQAALALLLIQGLGKKMPPENGRSRYDYHFDVTPEGKLVINGIDVFEIAKMLNTRR